VSTDDIHGGGLPPEHNEPVYPDDPFSTAPPEVITPTPIPGASLAAGGGGGGRNPPPPSAGDPDDEDEGMLRMSFLEHLEELRSRIIKALYGLGLVFLVCVIFSTQLFRIVLAPGQEALRATGDPLAQFIAINPMEQFSIMWVWTPLVASLFLGSPWILWQVWSFISPGLYYKEKRWAVPFVLSTATLFLAGGAFGYFLAFRYGTTFLFGLGQSVGVHPMISIDSYFDIFVDVMLGIGAVFELPVLIFFLTLIHVASPSFLLNHSRYAILGIVILAAIITPTPDVFNLMLFAVPMCLLFFLGIFASYLLVLKREKQKFPWRAFMMWLGIVALVLAAALALAITQFHLHWVWHKPFLVR
jgi:sec-independent protein translocase protein TatC